MAVDELDALSGKFEGCRTLAFADLSAQMILVTNSTSTLSREVLDDLCAEAILMLGLNGKMALGTQPSTLAMVVGQNDMHVFVRSTIEPNDALCCICSSQIDLDAFLQDARLCLERISGG